MFITANKFIVEPGVEIKGDLFICANEIILSKNAVVHGNVYAVCNKINLNCQFLEICILVVKILIWIIMELCTEICT